MSELDRLTAIYAPHEGDLSATLKAWDVVEDRACMPLCAPLYWQRRMAFDGRHPYRFKLDHHRQVIC